MDWYDPEIANLIYTLVYITTSIFVIILVILENGRPIKTLSWILVILLLPFIGIIIYLFFGKNLRKEKIFNQKEIADLERILLTRKKQSEQLTKSVLLDNPDLEEKLGIIRLLFSNSKALLSQYNELEIFHDGDPMFSQYLKDLEAAKHHIHVQFYIIEDDHIGRELKKVLTRKAREGVEVRVVYDYVGSWGITKRYVRELRKAGIEVHPFMPVRFHRLATKFNYRNHRKLTIVDGRVGYIGGMNAADRYTNRVEGMNYWRDTHLRLRGDAVRSMQLIFSTDWYFASGRKLNKQIYFPKTRIREKKLVQIVASGPDSDWASIMQAYFYAITTARHYVYITTPYFIPNESILTALRTLGLSGVDVRIMMPADSDSRIAHYSGMSYVAEVLEAGVKVLLYEKGFIHSKVIIVDDIFVSVGSANVDIRSFDQNFEVNALIYSPETAIEMRQRYLEDMVHCRELDAVGFARRPRRQKVKESLARIFSPLL